MRQKECGRIGKIVFPAITIAIITSDSRPVSTQREANKLIQGIENGIG